MPRRMRNYNKPSGLLMKADGRDIRDVAALKNVFKISFDEKKASEKPK